MSIPPPPGQPSIGDVLTRSFRDAVITTKSNLWLCIVLAVLGTVCAAILASSGALSAYAAAGAPGTPRTPPALPPLFYAAALLAYSAVAMLAFYAIAAAVRIIEPEYRMDAGQFFGFLGYSIVAGLLSLCAALFFLIPGYWVGTKLFLTPYAYAITRGEAGVLGRTWNMTTGYFWQTLGMFFVMGFILSAVMYPIGAMLMLGGSDSAVSFVIAVPIMCLVLAFLIHVRALVYVHWTAGLLPRARAPEIVPVPA